MSNLLGFLLTIILAFLGTNAFGHGEDKPGPHGGQIRMPGAFHTELVKLSATKVAIYLLDISFKNPVVRDSSVDASFEINGTKVKLNCNGTAIRFECESDRASFESGQLEVSAVRQGVRGVTSVFDLSAFQDNQSK